MRQRNVRLGSGVAALVCCASIVCGATAEHDVFGDRSDFRVEAPMALVGRGMGQMSAVGSGAGGAAHFAVAPLISKPVHDIPVVRWTVPKAPKPIREKPQIIPEWTFDIFNASMIPGSIIWAVILVAMGFTITREPNS